MPYFGLPFQFNPAAGSTSLLDNNNNNIRVIDPPRRPHSGVWFILQASLNQAKEPFLPQIPKSFIRIKDGGMTVRLLIKYLVNKLHLDSESQVPELFYLPEIFTNENSIDFGTTQLGGKLDSVKLPPWADSSVDFIHKHRMALESEHVSAHLHEWIDLVFGCGIVKRLLSYLTITYSQVKS